MIRKIVKGVDGKEVVMLIPETDEDMAELERMAKVGELDARQSFADDPDAWKEDE